MSRSKESRRGFTLVELAVVIVIIGVLAAFGVPQFLKSVERSKASEAFNYLAAIRSAQERYAAKNGVYWSGTIDKISGSMTSTSGAAGSASEVLDINQTMPKYFSGGSVSTDIVVNSSNALVSGVPHPTWDCTLTRLSTSSSYGAYTVVFDEDGYIPPSATTRATAPSTIMDEISPMGQ
jgi:type IV pilus assembly protein PilA